MPGLIGKKVGMTSVFDDQGKNVPCTVIEVGPCVVTQIKTKDKDGYSAVQLAYDDKKEKHTSKAMLGHFKKAKTTPMIISPLMKSSTPCLLYFILLYKVSVPSSTNAETPLS